MSFREWLKRFRNDETALGDLARDVARDRCFPRGRVELETYERHLTETHDAMPGAVEALHAAWTQYEAAEDE